MELSDFVIGATFWTHAGAFRCTDIGTRVVVAVKLGPREIARAESVDGELRISKRSRRRSALAERAAVLKK
jgi:hypothetical protein